MRVAFPRSPCSLGEGWRLLLGLRQAVMAVEQGSPCLS